MIFTPTLLPNIGPANISIDYKIMQERWGLIYDLLGGTKTMRDRGDIWLPREPRESKQAYESRLKRTFLYNAFKRTIKAYVGSAFLKDVSVSNVPPQLEYLIRNCDSTGRNLTTFCSELCEDILITGKCHNFVDNPSVKGPVSLAEMRESNIRPYFNRIDPRNLFAWRTTYSNNKENITQIRFRERSVEENGEWAESEILRVRVIRPGHWMNYTYSVGGNGSSGEYIPETEGSFELDYIPLVTVYDKKIAPMVAFPPLEDLAWLNLRHWQSTSDQNNILHVVRVPLLFARGFQEGELDNLEIGANRLVSTTNAQADMKHIEHNGNAISSGRQDLIDLEVRMSHMGSDILTSKSVERQTATARKVDQAESMSVFQVILRNLEHGIEESFRMAGDWINVDASEVMVNIGDDFSIPGSESNIIENISALHEMGKLSDEEFYDELMRRGILSSHVKVKKVPRNEKQQSQETTEELPDVRLEDDRSRDVDNE